MSALALAAMGEVPEPVLTRIESELLRAFRFPVLRAEALPEPAQAFDRARGQWSSVEFLKALVAHRPRHAAKLLGVTERDLFVPVLSFVYGQAQLAGPVAVISLARLRPEFHALPGDEETLLRRAATEAVHEVGHTFGLVHCADRRCPMSLSIDLPDLDRKTARLCRSCALLVQEGLQMERSRREDNEEGGRS